MAESVAHDVVKEAQSVGPHHQPSDDLANTSNELSAGNGQATTSTITTNATTTTTTTPESAASSEHSPNNAHDSNRDAHVAESAAATAEGGSAADQPAAKGSAEADGSDKKGGSASASNLSDGVAQGLADASGGSDTDTSRADTGKEDGKGHSRTGSLKKPTTFKPVSVTKSFLAKSLSASPVPRAGDKVGPSNSPSPTSALQSAKPRLVAKSVLGGSTRGMTTLNGTASPDASKVWNKNRPAAPPPPRQFTDEELQTRYGIHMTARLQSDESGKDSKWADIDDDEEDWAPETVEWMDGTKSSVGAEPQPPPPPPRQEDRASSPSKKEPTAEPVKPVLTSMNKSAATQSNKTILRPGSQLNASPKPGAAQKAGADKSPSGGTKPSQPPAKSPWAVLPPVEKIPPINPPVQQTQRPFARDSQGYDAHPPAPAPAQEIAADDFSRNYGGDRAPRELFNAQSGRYEPANDTRRGSRNEHGHRQPAVLQRPSQGGTHMGPAEPSPAFQTSRSSADSVGPWSRRRASSSLSAGGRRPSLALSQDHAQHPHPETAAESPRAGHAILDRPGLWSRPGHSHMEPPVAGSGQPSDGSQQPIEDPIAKQQRMMKEKIEQARIAKQKRLEEEAAEAAARQERLKLKMAQLASASPSPDVHDGAAKGTGSQNAAVQPPKSNTVSPPKPPVPTSEGEVAQYGMMKLHQPHPVKKNFVSEASLTSRSNQDSGSDYSHRFRGSTSPSKTVARPSGGQQQHHANSASEKAQQQKGLPNAPPNASGGPLEKLGSSWTSSPSSNDYNWGPNSMSARSAVGGSVWGPLSLSSNEKSLGNGTFESKFSHPNFVNNRFDNGRASGLPAQGPPMHGPVGSGIKGAATPPQRQSQFTHTFQSLSSEHSANSTSAASAAATNEQQEQPPTSHSPSVDDQAFVSAHLDSSLQQSIAQSSSLHPQTTSQPSYSASSGNNMSAQVALPPTAPIGSGKASLGSQDRARDWHLGGGRATQKSWQSFGADEQRKREAEVAKYQREMATSKPQPKSGGIVTYDVYREGPGGNTVEVFHVAVQPDGQKTTRRGGTFPMSPNNAAKVRESEALHPEDHPPKSEQPVNGVAQSASTTSSSRFFPKGAAPVISTQPQSEGTPTQPQIAITQDETPPPAEQDLFDHDSSQPVKVKFPVIAKVNLPGMKASPSVSLPPRSPGVDKSFSGQAPGTSSGPSGPRTLPHTMRVDDLKAKFGNTQPGGIFANTKPAFDVTAATTRPNGALQNQQPRSSPTSVTKHQLFAVNYSSSPQSQPLAEDDCFDFPDFGSKPTVRVPKVPHQNHQFGYQHEGAMSAPLPRHMKFHVLETQTVSEVQLFPTEKGDKFGSKVTIKLPAMKTAKYVDVRLSRRGGRSDNTPREGGASSGRGGRGGSSRSGPSEGGSRRGAGGHGSRGGNKHESAGRGAKKGDATTGASNSSSSSPKPRGGAHWGSKNGRGGGTSN
ncbi:uncharacterized protein PV09_08758 [Verruconis gallopava]|uniref:Uncharacterized protein n=1 Tax=Verruconis gallopava TaxID=253628 RepID=A0A0D1YFR6_9PEZI|nr:uncharacterized protein PV09_08758 [Verruconis gallopava]KIV99581.1 hypothetical protein PV09_08758 [Verruconis gallopava]